MQHTFEIGDRVQIADDPHVDFVPGMEVEHGDDDPHMTKGGVDRRASGKTATVVAFDTFPDWYVDAVTVAIDGETEIFGVPLTQAISPAALTKIEEVSA